MTTSIAKLKAELGLELPRSPSERDPPVIVRLFTGIEKIKERYSNLNPPQRRASEAFKADASKLFEKLGAALWPDFDGKAEIPSWLSYPTGESDEQGQSRRYYSNSTDRIL
jgi:hypothetical protein